jgi:hypothetical protein
MRAGMKRVILTSAISMVASVTFADQGDHLKDSFKDYCPPPPALHDGFYTGLQGGYDSYRIRQKINLTGGITSNPVLNATGVAGGIFVGYGKQGSCFFE